MYLYCAYCWEFLIVHNTFCFSTEIIRQHQRAINKSIREMDREKMRLEAEEQKIIREIKKMAKEGQMVRKLLSGPRTLFVCPLNRSLLFRRRALLFVTFLAHNPLYSFVLQLMNGFSNVLQHIAFDVMRCRVRRKFKQRISFERETT